MFVCFRWLLVFFKREFSTPDIIELWERLWTSSHRYFHIFFAFALLHSQRKNILELNAFDELLKFVNDESGKWAFKQGLWRASILLDQFQARLIPLVKLRLGGGESIEQRFSGLDLDNGLEGAELFSTECDDAELCLLNQLLNPIEI